MGPAANEMSALHCEPVSIARNGPNVIVAFNVVNLRSAVIDSSLPKIVATDTPVPNRTNSRDGFSRLGLIASISTRRGRVRLSLSSGDDLKP